VDIAKVESFDFFGNLKDATCGYLGRRSCRMIVHEVTSQPLKAHRYMIHLMKAKEIRVPLLKLPLLSSVKLDSHVICCKSEIHTKAPRVNQPSTDEEAQQIPRQNLRPTHNLCDCEEDDPGCEETTSL